MKFKQMLRVSEGCVWERGSRSLQRAAADGGVGSGQGVFVPTDE